MHKFISVLLLLATALTSTFLWAAQGGEAVVLRKTYSGNIDYVTVGASFRDQPNNVNACSFVSPMTSTVSVDIPIGAVVLDAYLYFAGSANGTNNLATQSGLALNGVAVNTVAGLNERDYPELQNVILNNINFFGARRDVSSIVTGPGAYTFSGLSVHQGATNQTCVGAWALVVIFEDPNVSQIRVVNLFDGFQFYQNDTFDLEPRNFVVDDTSPQGKMSHISFEGDATLGTAGENFLFSVDGTAFTALINNDNPLNNQYNDTVTGPGLFPSTTEYGLDVDTYDLGTDSAFHSGLLTAGAFEAVTRYNSGQDLVLLMSEVIQVDNKPLADLEVTLNDVGVFTENTTNDAQYIISIQNNGDGIPGSTTAFAEGFVHVYNDLPAGISIDALSDITAPGWDCSETNLAGDEIRCTYDLSTLVGGNLDPFDSLPDIVVTVDVATPTSPVTNIVRITNCANDPDNCETFAGKHQFSNQFDPVNFFEESEVDIFSVDEKSSINNNVDAEITPIVGAMPSDLSTSTKTVSAPSPLTPGDTVTYTITLIESSGNAATGITVTDIIDTDTTNFSLTNNCGGTDTFSLGTLTVSGISLAGSASCTIVIDVDIPGTAAPGTSIDNTASISSTSGTGASPSAPTLLVSGTATGSKVLYFDDLDGTEILTRAAPSTNTSQLLSNGASVTLNLSPVLTSDLQINQGVIPVSVWIEGTVTSGNNYSVTADLGYTGVASIDTDTIAGVSMTAVGGGNTLDDVAQLFPFQLDLPSDITDLNTSEELILTITNNSTDSIRVHTFLNNIDSKVVVDAEDVINVDTVKFFDDPARGVSDEIISPNTIEAGEIIYIEAVVSDPFGSADITAATLTLIDPNLANQLTNVAMTEDSSTAGTKTYVYAYTIPDATSIDPGLWVAQVTAFEGAEGTVTHTDAGSFTTSPPAVSVDYTVDKLTADNNGELLTYTITITNDGLSAAILDISQLVPVGTNNVAVTVLPSGTDTSSGTSLNITGINAPGGGAQTVIEFTVNTLGTLQPGDLIDHTITLDNSGTDVSDIAPSVLINPFDIHNGNKPIYADAFSTVRRFDRTEPTTNTSTTISSQGASQQFTLAPVLQSSLTLDPGDITASVWVSRGMTSFAGQRDLQATLGYTGAASGTIDTDSITIQLGGGTNNAQYIPFTFNLGSTLILPANTSLTLTLTNNTSVAGETVTAHTLRLGEASLISLNANNPLEITSLEFYTDSITTVNPGTPITVIAPSSEVWVRAIVTDPFGRDDINDNATLSISDPSLVEQLPATQMMSPAGQQPSSQAQKLFELNYTLGSDIGNWNATVIANEGVEGIVDATDTALISTDLTNLPDLTNSFKSVVNITTGNNANTNPGDTLRYTIELINSGLVANATGVSFSDAIPANTTFASGSYTIGGVPQADPGNPIAETGLVVPAAGSLIVTFDVVINGGATVGSLISNTVDITNPNGQVTNITRSSEDLVITGVPATGTKLIYLEDLNSTPFLTRAEPQTAGTADSIVLENAGEPVTSVTLDLTPALAKDIALDPTDGDILVTLRLQGVGANNRNRAMTVDLGYQNGGAITSLGTASQNVNLFTGSVVTSVFTIPVNALTTIPAGNQLQLTVTNNQGNPNRDLRLLSFDSGNNRSSIALVPDPVINVDSITFWTGPGMTGTQVNNPNPDNIDVDIYAHIIISDPFGEDDIQAFDAATNPSTITITDPDAAVSDGGTNQSCTAPCFAYVGEVVDADAATKSFDYLIRIDSDPPSTRGTWSIQVTANEGLEGDVSHTTAANFSTLLGANLSTSTKEHDVVGDVSSGSQFTYTITLNNTGGLDADNVALNDTLQTSPVALSFVSAATTCTDESAAPLPNPSFSAGDVTLTNISVTAGGSCVVTITVSAGAGTPGQLIDNTAVLTNPNGPSGTPAAPTILFEESLIPIAGSKQLYLDGLNSTTVLSRTQPGSADNITLAEGAGVDDIVLDLDNVTTRAMTIGVGTIDVKLLLAETGGGRNRQTEVQLLADTDANSSFETELGENQITLSLDDTPTLRTFSFAVPAEVPLAAGASFRLIIRNNQPQGGRVVILHQEASAPFSQVVIPLINSLEVTDVSFFNLSATDDSVTPGCDVTFSCGTEINPGLIVAGSTIWVRATAADGFGSFDVNTGCTGGGPTNCPTITATNPSASATTNDMVFVNAPDASSRTYEFEVNPVGLGQDGTWQVDVEFSEGVEGLIFDQGVNTFERFQPPVLMIVKSVAGVTNPGEVVTYTNLVTHEDGSLATDVLLTNTLGDFVQLELTGDGVTDWTALLSLSGGFTFINEEFDDDVTGPFDYDPTTTGPCALPVASPCYDPAIQRWRIQLVEEVPIGGSVTQEYRGRLE